MSDLHEYFLGVDRSVKGQAWVPRISHNRDADAIAGHYDVPELLARVLAGRGVPFDDVPAYLNPTLRDLMPQPEALADLPAGAKALADAICKSWQIGVIGDYDVDGMTSVSLLSMFLRASGTDCDVHIPKRIGEGYGPSRAAVEQLKANGAKVLVTLDCGVMAHDPLAHAAELGLETIIIDHHQAGEELPSAKAVINPNRNDDLSGQGHLCAAGVLLIVLAATSRELRRSGWWSQARPEPDLLQWLDLVALATVCDVVPLKGLNRAYVMQGLKVMSARGNSGVAALADVARLTRKPDPYALGFVLGPRLNAAGRIGDALRGVQLLTCGDRGEAMQIAQELEALNRKRQVIEQSILDDAMMQADAALGASGSTPVLLVSGQSWHPGVLGLVAARLKERFRRPSVAVGFEKDSGVASGSGRSIPGVDLGSAVRAAADAGVIEKGGGHAMAAGLSVDPKRIGDLRTFLEVRLADSVDTATRVPELKIDGALTATAATPSLVETLDRAGPYGAGNPAPVFVFPAHRIVHADAVGTDHVRCTLVSSGGDRLKAIAFRSLGSDLGELLLSERAHPLHVAGRLSIDDWGGKRRGQLMIEDAARTV